MNASDFSAQDYIQVLIARHYEKERGASFVSVGNVPEFDVRFKNQTSIEIKVDTTAARTHNACIEFWDVRRSKPTGILETQATDWLHCVPEGDTLRCYEMDTKKLLKLCFECGQVKSGGDYNASLLKLIPLQEIREISNSDFVLSCDYIKSILRNADGKTI